jgi:hypothetical protein
MTTALPVTCGRSSPCALLPCPHKLRAPPHHRTTTPPPHHHTTTGLLQPSPPHSTTTTTAARRQHRGVHAYVHDYSDGPPPPPQQEQQQPAATSGMRLKVTRHMCFFQDPEGLAKPWLDLGLGFNLDMDRQELQPVARLKLKDVLSLKVAPEPLVKLAHSMRLPGVGMVVKLLYELPLRQTHRFWQPPARLMLRLDSVPGEAAGRCVLQCCTCHVQAPAPAHTLMLLAACPMHPSHAPAALRRLRLPHHPSRRGVRWARWPGPQPGADRCRRLFVPPPDPL